MATLHVAGTLSASPSTLTLAESHISDGNNTKGLLVADSGCLSPARSEFSSSVTLADEKDTRDDTFTVCNNWKNDSGQLGYPGTDEASR